MLNYDLMQLLNATGKMPQQVDYSGLGMNTSPLQQVMYNGMMPRQQQPQQNQQPSWLDALNQTMMLGYMMPQQQPFSMGNYGMGMNGYGQQQMQPQTGWQKGFTGAGQFLQGISTPATNLGGIGLTMGNPYAGLLAGAGVASGGLGNLLQYLGQPGVQQ
jgi:hypothetical protein